MAKILLADDSGTAQRMGAQILSAEGHEVSTVSNGQAAIKLLAKFQPDLIVADVFMPGRTGYELCEYIKSDPASAWIPVLLIVAPMEPYDATEGKRVKADGLVTKPLDKSNLVETVQALLASSQRPAPAAAPKKRGAKAATAKHEPAPEPAEMREFPAEEDPTIPAITNTAALHIEIPEEMREQPVSLIGELLEPAPEAPSAEPLVEDELVIERSSGEEELVIERSSGEDELVIERSSGEEILPLEIEHDQLEMEPSTPLEIERNSPLEAEPVTPLEAILQSEPSEPDLSVTDIESEPEAAPESAEEQPSAMERLFAAAAEVSSEEPAASFEQPAALPEEPPALPEEPVMAPEAPEVLEPALAIPAAPSEEVAAAPEPSWTADLVDVLEEDRKLFGQAVPDWQGLVNMVQEEGEIPAAALAGTGTPAKQTSVPSPEAAAHPPDSQPQPPPEPERKAAPPPAPEKAPPPPAPEPAEPPAMSDTIAMLKPQIAPLDYITVEQIVRETIEEIMPQIVERISQATGLQFQKNDPSKESKAGSS